MRIVRGDYAEPERVVTSPIDAIEELVADVRRGALGEATAMMRLRRLVAQTPARDDGPDWYSHRTETGWEVRDENGETVAVVPDPLHEREDSVVQMVEGSRASDYYGRLVRAGQRLKANVNAEMDARRGTIRHLVGQIEKDARQMAAQLAGPGPDLVTSTWIAAHVRELTEAQTNLDERRHQLRAIEQALEDDA